MQPNRPATLRQKFNLSSLALAYPWVTISFWVAIAIAGMVAFSSLKYALFPDVTFPVVVIDASAPFKTALETEQSLTQPLETELGTLAGLDGIKSASYAGRSALTLSFGVGQDLAASEKTVSQALADIELPEGASFKVIPFNLNESAAVSYAIYGQDYGQAVDAADLPDSPEDGPALTVAEVLPLVRDRVIPRLEAIPGVLRVKLLGEGTETNPEDNLNDNALGDSSSPGPETASNTLVRFRGQDALALEVIKTAAANTLEVVDAADGAIAELRTELPQLALVQASTQASFIRAATNATLEDLFLAIGLAVLIIFPFLWSIRATIITALAIPISLLGTFIVMAAAGFNLETITLLALALVIGIIIDDAIVDVENISRHIDNGQSPKQAAHTATAEIGMTVAAATLTIVAVFLPIGLMGGTVGQFFKPFGLTVSAAVLISLLVSRTLSPVLAALWLRRSDSPSRVQKPQTGLWDQILEVYRGLLRWSLNHRWWVVSFALASLVLGLALTPLIPRGFIPKLDRGSFNLTYSIAGPRLQAGIEAQLAANPSLALAGSGFDSSSFSTYQVQPGDSLSRIAADRLGSSAAAGQLAQLNQLAPTAPLEVGQTLRIPSDSPQSQPPQSQIPPSPGLPDSQITALSLQTSRQIAQELEQVVGQNPNVESVFAVLGDRSLLNQGRLFIQLKGDRAAHTAIIQDQIRQTLPSLENVTLSVEDIPFVDTGGEKPLQIALQGQGLEPLLATGKRLGDRLRTRGYVDVTVSGEDSDAAAPTELLHKDGKRTVYVTANLSQGQALGDATEVALAEAETLLPAGVSLDLGGDSAHSDAVLGSFGITLALSVGCMALVLVTLFQRILDPLVVLLSLPLAIVGAILGLVVTQSDFGMIAVIGIILLMGLVDKSAILIIDYINQLREKGLSRLDAILEAGPVRLRPILMTALSTILGMMPIALGIGAGSELRQPLAVAAIGGLITSTLLSLVVVPVVYSLFDDLQGYSKAHWSKWRFKQ
ncbi:MAG: efflux RND transporter permease subunit [Synechococcales cyanobacterium RM1_1_8]|nr:efflux RND transporter permease subunit [Synechococcales cyanobacterium RM1_1_8]